MFEGSPQRGLGIPQHEGMRGQYAAALLHPHLFSLAKESREGA